jgi:hypothetical protein
MRRQKLHASLAAPALCRRLEVLCADPVPQDSTLDLNPPVRQKMVIICIYIYIILLKWHYFVSGFGTPTPKNLVSKCNYVPYILLQV